MCQYLSSEHEYCSFLRDAQILTYTSQCSKNDPNVIPQYTCMTFGYIYSTQMTKYLYAHAKEFKNVPKTVQISDKTVC
jgi:hypothetical protein